MLKRLFFILFVVIFMSSCSYFDSKFKPPPVQVVDTIVDFNTIDAFPLFPECKEIPSREKQQICFQLQMSMHINAGLKKLQLSAFDAVSDTLMVKLKIDSNGKTTLSNLKISAATKKIFPQLDSVIKAEIENLPILEPAIKRNLPVTTEFVLPIVLKN